MTEKAPTTEQAPNLPGTLSGFALLAGAAKIDLIADKLTIAAEDLPGISVSGQTQNALLLAGDEFEIAIMAIDAPFPIPELEVAASQSLLFSDAAKVATDQQAHVAVQASVTGTTFAARRTALVTVSRLIAALDPLGVYWPHSGVISGIDGFVDITPNAQSWPVTNWFGARSFSDGGAGALSIGASSLLGYEIAILPASGASPQSQLKTLFGVLAWTVEVGPVVTDGQKVQLEAASAYRAELRRGNAGEPDVMALRAVNLTEAR